METLCESFGKNGDIPSIFQTMRAFHLQGPVTPAAVMMLLSCDETNENDLQLLFLKRPSHLRSHPGQIGFPGGKKDTSDPNLLSTALRETKEELGIEFEDLSIVSELPSLLIPTGFQVTPFLAFHKTPKKIIPNPNEVERIFTVPLRTFEAPPLGKFPKYGIECAGEWIWGASYFMTKQLLFLLHTEMEYVKSQK